MGETVIQPHLLKMFKLVFELEQRKIVGAGDGEGLTTG